MFLLFLPVVPEVLFARSYLLSPNACIIFLKTLWDENLRGGWSQYFFFICLWFKSILNHLS